MASSAWQSKLQEAQDLTNKGAKRELGKDYSIAFQCYVRAGELYLWLVRQAEGPSDTSQLKAAADRVLSRAHAIKKVIANVQSLPRRLLSEEEQARALSLGARIDLNNLPEWGPHCCYPATDAQMQPLPLLAPRQVEQSAQYMCCSELSAISCGSLYHCESPLQGRQIVQRVVTDCSFVAALEVAAAHDASWGTQASLLVLYCPLLFLSDTCLVAHSSSPMPHYTQKTTKATLSGALRLFTTSACTSMERIDVWV